MGLQVTDKYYEHIHERAINIIGTTIMWGTPVITDGTILANRPDVHVVLHDKKEKTCLLIDIAILGDSDVNTKKMEKLRGPPLAIELQKITLMSTAHSICRVLG
jgi:hypothetical protein